MKEGKMDIETRRFLTALATHNGAASRKDLPLADRAQDRVRQRARRAGYIEYGGGMWHLTTAGRNALAASGAALADRYGRAE
jgi:hypothetical protein